MTVTPMISLLGMRARSGGSARNWNLLIPIGRGPTRTESSSWSYSFLERVSQVGVQLVASQSTHEVADPT